MKYLFAISLTVINVISFSQNIRIDPHSYELCVSSLIATENSLTNDTSFDVKFYHLDVEPSLDSAFIRGNVSYLLISRANNLNTIKLDLDSAFIVDSIIGFISSYSFYDNAIYIDFSESYNINDTFSFTIYYQGVPELAGGYKGLRYEVHDDDEPVIASLSTPYLAHTWWPCKDGPEDKADSVFIDITIKDTIINLLPVTAVSNGLLDTIVNYANKKTFKWKHHYPIVPYYVMVAISNYYHFQQIYSGLEHSFPIDYYVFHSHLEEAQSGAVQIPDVMDYFSEVFGPYPFSDEKYAMTQLGYYGGIENQTNSIVNSMGTDRFILLIHELAHQWFGDMITCKTWNHGWLNEGFASYAEALYHEHAYGFDYYQGYMSYFEFYDPGTLYLEDVSDPFNVFRSIIYNKGAYVLHMLRGVMGDQDFFTAVYSYANDERYKYKNAVTEDFRSICENISGLELQYFFEQWIYDEFYPVYRYNFEYDEEAENLEIAIVQDQSNLGWREVYTMPVELKIDFSNGTDTILKVFNDSQFQSFSFNLNTDIHSVTFDPVKRILKEVNYDPDIDIGIKKFKIYPNPNEGIFTVDFSKAPSNNDVRLRVFDLNGKVIIDKLIRVENDDLYEIDLNQIQNGFYILCLTSGNINYSSKFIITK